MATHQAQWKGAFSERKLGQFNRAFFLALCFSSFDEFKKIDGRIGQPRKASLNGLCSLEVGLLRVLYGRGGGGGLWDYGLFCLDLHDRPQGTAGMQGAYRFEKEKSRNCSQSWITERKIILRYKFDIRVES